MHYGVKMHILVFTESYVFVFCFLLVKESFVLSKTGLTLLHNYALLYLIYCTAE